MRCHYIYDEIAGKVHTPGCYPGIYNPKDCICRPETFEQFEKELYNKKVAELITKIKDLQQHIFCQERIIKKLIKKNNKKKKV